MAKPFKHLKAGLVPGLHARNAEYPKVGGPLDPAPETSFSMQRAVKPREVVAAVPFGATAADFASSAIKNACSM